MLIAVIPEIVILGYKVTKKYSNSIPFYRNSFTFASFFYKRRWNGGGMVEYSLRSGGAMLTEEVINC